MRGPVASPALLPWVSACAGPSASVAAVACAPAEGRCLRLVRPGSSRANVVETMDATDLKPKYESECLSLAESASSVKVITT